MGQNHGNVDLLGRIKRLLSDKSELPGLEIGEAVA
jgi:hypothetical protein